MKNSRRKMFCLGYPIKGFWIKEVKLIRNLNNKMIKSIKYDY